VKKGNCKTVKNEKPSKTVKMVIFEVFCHFSRKPQKVRILALLGDSENASKMAQNRGFLALFEDFRLLSISRKPSISLYFTHFWRILALLEVLAYS
jgi:hypothetical protein